MNNIRLITYKLHETNDNKAIYDTNTNTNNNKHTITNNTILNSVNNTNI